MNPCAIFYLNRIENIKYPKTAQRESQNDGSEFSNRDNPRDQSFIGTIIEYFARRGAPGNKFWHEVARSSANLTFGNLWKRQHLFSFARKIYARSLALTAPREAANVWWRKPRHDDDNDDDKRVENSIQWDAVPTGCREVQSEIATTTTTATTLPAAVSDHERDSFTYLKALLACFPAPRFLAATKGGLRNIECLLRKKIDFLGTYVPTKLRSHPRIFAHQHVAAWCCTHAASTN